MFKREGKSLNELDLDQNKPVKPFLKFVLFGLGIILVISFFAYVFLNFTETKFVYVLNRDVDISMRREGLEIKTEGNLIVYSRGTWKGCNADFNAWMEKDGNIINIYEEWTNEAPKCGKFYMSKGTIENLGLGSYRINIYEKGDPDLLLKSEEIGVRG